MNERFILSSTEKAILNLIAKEFTFAEISVQLLLPRKIIKRRYRRLLKKLQVKTTVGLARWAILLGLDTTP